ncbi:MAG: Ig-like domain-containing protein, partial [Burkholderiaceae bacterium]|nr:Ig-like domain-containing protein [Burkholderiaceae bacterium]
MTQQITVTNKAAHTTTTVTGPDVSLSALSIVELPMSHSEVKSLARRGNDLVITTTDGQQTVVHGFFVDNPASGHNDLVFQDNGGLWLGDLSGFDALPVDSSVDPSAGGIFSSIDSINPLFNDAPAVAAPDADSSAGGFGGLGDLGGGMEILPVALAVAGFATALNSSSSGTAYSDSALTSALSIGAVTQNPSGTLTVGGTGVAGTTVTVTYPDHSTVSGTVDASGNYSITSSGVQTTGTVSAVDSDSSGDSSAPVSQTWTDTTVPQAPVVSTVTVNSDGTVTVTGTAEVDSTVTVNYADGTSATAVVQSDGSYTIASSTAETGAATVTATDAAGNVSAAASTTLTTDSGTVGSDGTMTVTGVAAAGSLITVTFSDGSTATGTATGGSYSISSSGAETAVTSVAAAIAPPAPVIESVSIDAASGDMTVTGTAQPYAIVMVTFTDGSYGEGVATADGTWSATSQSAETGSGTVSVQALNSTSGTGSAASTVTALVDTSTANTDGTLTVAGTAQANSIVTVTFADGSTATGTAQSDGSYSIQSSGPETAVTSITAVNQPPQGPEVTSVAPNSDGTVVVTGTAEANSVVTVTFADGSTAMTTAGSDGSYSVSSSAAEPSSGTVTASYTDTTGIVSTVTSHDYATAAQPTAINTIANNDGTMTVSGTAAVGDTLTITFPDNSTATATTESNGSYTVTSGTVQTNGNVSVVATDTSGNISQPLSVNYNDNVAPQAPVVSTTTTSATDGTVTVTGMAEANSIVTVNFADGTSATGTTQSNGSYTVTSVTAETGTIGVTATDQAGNVSVTTTIAPPAEITAIQNDTAGAAGLGSTADFITSDNALSFSGALNAALSGGQSLEISTNGGQSWHAVTDVSGTSWSYNNTANPLPDGNYNIEVREVDSSGNPVGTTGVQQVVIDTTPPTETATF